MKRAVASAESSYDDKAMALKMSNPLLVSVRGGDFIPHDRE